MFSILRYGLYLRLRKIVFLKKLFRFYLNIETYLFRKIASGVVVNRFGTEFRIDPSNSIDLSFAQDRYEKETSKFLNNFLNNGDIVIEAGANVGTQSFLIASLISPQGMVYAIEPSEYGIGMLKVRRSNSSYRNNVQLIEAFCGDGSSDIHQTSCLARFPERANAMHLNTEHVTDGRYISIDEVVRLYVGEAQGKKVKLLKIDVDGPELYCLRGAIHTIESFSPVVLVEISETTLGSFGHSSKDIFKFMNDLGYHYSASILRKCMTDLRDVENSIKDGSHDDIIFYNDINELKLLVRQLSE